MLKVWIRGIEGWEGQGLSKTKSWGTGPWLWQDGGWRACIGEIKLGNIRSGLKSWRMTDLGQRSLRSGALGPDGPSPLEQCCLTELSAVMENFYICAKLSK